MLISKSMEVFMTIAQEKNIKKAANKLCLTIPPISRMLKNTEEWYGERLFKTERNGVTLTPAGEHLYKKLYRHYYEIKKIRRNGQSHIIISSPFIQSPFLSRILSVAIENSDQNITTRLSECISDSDAIFIDFKHHNAPNFNLIEVPLSLGVYVKKDAENNWKNKNIHIGSNMRYMDSFLLELEKLHAINYKGLIIVSDNQELNSGFFESGKNIIIRNEFLMEGRDDIYEIERFSQSLFIYTNKAQNETEFNFMLQKTLEPLWDA